MASVFSGSTLTINAYSQRAWATNKFAGKPDALTLVMLGLFGEVGGLLTVFKKARRDNPDNDGATFESSDIPEIEEEAGDAIWYLNATAQLLDLDLEDVARVAMTNLALAARLEFEPAEPLTFRDLDALLTLGERRVITDYGATLARLGAAAGDVLLHGQKDEVGQREIGAAELGNMFYLISVLVVCIGKNVTGIVEQNLAKVESRWPKEKQPSYLPLFDQGDRLEERLPRSIAMQFKEYEYEDGGKSFVIQSCHGINIGDRLTDNRQDEDEDLYRFHDVFHMAYAVYLGWSPVLRSLFKCKRKSKSKIDEVEDGARAILVEEAISAWVFHHSKKNRNKMHFVGVEVGDLSYSMLKQILDLVDGLCVDQCPAWQWEKAILEGFNVFRQLIAERGGMVVADLNERTLEFRSFKTKAGDFIPLSSAEVS
jgi:NTP pyrophosphatase (non-canonical NTP hydrolase)